VGYIWTPSDNQTSGSLPHASLFHLYFLSLIEPINSYSFISHLPPKSSMILFWAPDTHFQQPWAHLSLCLPGFPTQQVYTQISIIPWYLFRVSAQRPMRVFRSLFPEREGRGIWFISFLIKKTIRKYLRWSTYTYKSSIGGSSPWSVCPVCFGPVARQHLTSEGARRGPGSHNLLQWLLGSTF
jgi:hypothetical protein